MTEHGPGAFGAAHPDAAAVIMADGGVRISYRELDERSKRFAQLLRAAGLQPGDHLAILLDNHPRYFEVFWGAQRAGLYTTPVNWHLKAAEAGYIIADCGATALVTSAALGHIARQLDSDLGPSSVRLMIDGTIDGYDSYEAAIARFPAVALDDEVEGASMCYSSGTTRRPKDIKPSLTTSKARPPRCSPATTSSPPERGRCAERSPPRGAHGLSAPRRRGPRDGAASGAGSARRRDRGAPRRWRSGRG